MVKQRSFPDTDQLSVLTALILFVYALSPFIKIPGRTWEIQLPFAVFDITIGANFLVSLIASALAATGTDWLLRQHPKINTKSMLQHQILPALMAWVIAIPLTNISVDIRWWIVFIFGGVLMLMVFFAEYIVVDLANIHHLLATLGLTAVSFALYLFLVITVRSLNLRLYTLLPVVGGAIFFIVLRTLYLRLGGKWCWGWSIGVSLIVCQMVAGLHYLPFPPLVYGAFLTGTAYAITSIAGSLLESNSWRTAWVEPVLVIILMGIGVVVLVR